MERRQENIIGKKFGHLTAISPTKQGNVVKWLCQCDCGKKIYVRTAYLKSGRVKSCGCANFESAKSPTPEQKKEWLQKLEKGKKIDIYQGMSMAKIRKTLQGYTRQSISGVNGVTYVKARNTWKAIIYYKGEYLFLGTYKTLEEAVQARKAAEQKYYVPLLKKYEKREPAIREKVEKQWQKDVVLPIIKKWEKANKKHKKPDADKKLEKPGDNKK